MFRRTRRFAAAIITSALLLAAMTTAALADPRDFSLNNNSSFVVTHLYVSPTSDSDWGEDVLGKDVLLPGESWTVGFDRGDANTCVWDLKITVEGATDLTLSQVNLCATSNVNVN